MRYDESCDIIVVGSGHAGCEAALAAARMGRSVMLFTTSIDEVAMMPCNPSIGGPGKGHLVREIDALGGQMGRCIDATALQVRRLNVSKGQAVQSLRAQADRRRYHAMMRQTLEADRRVRLIEAIVVDVLVDDGRVQGVLTKVGRRYEAGAVVLCVGPYLASCVHVGDQSYSSGPRGQRSSDELADSLRCLGLSTRRFKTGTPPRVHKRSLDLDSLERLEGERLPYGFSFASGPIARTQGLCWVTYTNERTHAIIQANLHRSPMYSGAITGPGPRYCPSIEAKIVMFPDRLRHQVFIEPEGMDTQEMYLSGLSMSLPEDVQVEVVHSVRGLERAEFTRCGYAIEYDCLDPLQLTHALQLKSVPGLFTAGQINGTTGYEEAAAQGLMAGINAVRYVQGEEPVVLGRADAYIGVLVDDLVTKGTSEPYRILTSRAEYRLLLREGTADQRLMPLGRKLGLVGEEPYRAYLEKQQRIQSELARLAQVSVHPDEATNALLVSLGSAPLSSGHTLADLLRRPEVRYESSAPLDLERLHLPADVAAEVDCELQYGGYIERQRRLVSAHQKMEDRKIPQDLVYASVQGLSREGREMLERVRPTSIGQASRMQGVSPADIAVLLVHLEQTRRGLGHDLGDRAGDGKRQDGGKR